MNLFLSFSDSAKYADVARNLVSGLGYGDSFSFWGYYIFEIIKNRIFSSPGILPVMPFSIAAFFKIFGVTDFAVIATSFFYFVITLVFVFLLSKKIFKNNYVGILSTVAVGFNYDMINYATKGASESPFIFEIVAATYFASIGKKWANVVTVLLLILMYLTRPQAFIYIAGILLFWLLINFKTRKATIYFIAISLIGLIVDYFILGPLTGKFFLYSITARGINSALAQAVSSSPSDTLRGVAVTVPGGGLNQIIKNVFYNLYNFYKLLPQIINPYLFVLFVIGLFRLGKDKLADNFKVVAVFIIVVTLLVTAVSIPFIRYIHPIIPFVYIIAVGTLVEIISKQTPNPKSKIMISIFLVLFFGVGQTLGILVLDSRFVRNTHNIGKPPVYAALSKILKANTTSNQLVVTNLDTWGSWYGERKTVWFPLTPKQIIDPSTGKIPFDAIYLTSYLINDQNYYMGEEWRVIYENPRDESKWTCGGCNEIAEEFDLENIYTVLATDNYERQEAKAVLLIKR